MALDARRLKTLRERVGLTQEELAEAAGISFRTYQRYEYGDEVGADPKLEHAARLARALNTSTDYLAGLTDNADPKLVEVDLTEQERALIIALRGRQHADILRAFAELTQQTVSGN